MSITLYEKDFGNHVYGEIIQDKYSPLYVVRIAYYGKTLYKNSFFTMKNARQALHRNAKKHI